MCADDPNPWRMVHVSPLPEPTVNKAGFDGATGTLTVRLVVPWYSAVTCAAVPVVS